MSKSGVPWYTTGTAHIKVPFPEGRTVCQYCPYVTRQYGLRHACRLTDEILLYPESERGQRCPVEFEEVQP